MKHLFSGSHWTHLNIALGMMLIITTVSTAEENGTTPFGMVVKYGYTGEVFSNLSGGVKKGSEYRGKLDVTLTLDSEKVGLWKGTSLVIFFENTHGEGISQEYVGDFQLLSNIDSHNYSQVSEYYIIQNLFKNRIHLKLGKQDVNRDMNLSENSGEFINSSFGIMPNVPFPTYPNPALGISAQAIIKENLLIRVGLFDAKGKGGCWGFGTAFATDAHNVSALELDWRYWSSRRGSVKLGGWRRGGDCEVIGVSGSKSSNFGSYLILEQGILGNPENSGSCFDTFFQYGHAQDDRNDIPNYFGGGFTVKRLMKKRPDDVIGIGFACAVFNSKLASMEDETAIETFYLASVTNWLMVKPDVQYIMNPGGTEENAFVLGLRFFIAF